MDYPPRNERVDRRPARPRAVGVGPRQGAPSDARYEGPAERRAPRQGPPPRGRGAPVRKTPPPPPKPKPKRRGAKIILGLVSLLVMTLTGYAWAAMQGLVNGWSGADVLSADTGEKPADGARDILLVGLDSRTDAQGNPLSKELLAQLRAGVSDGELNTDTLIFVHIPNDGSKAVAISLPRDSYVSIPGFGKHKINSAFARSKASARKNLQEDGTTDAKDLELKSDQEGAKTLISTVENLTGQTIDNYASINLLGFSQITQAIGGVDVCLNDNVNDSFSGAKFTKGRHTISGADALAFVRQRHGLLRGDLDRVVRQQVFMAGLAEKVLSAGTLADPTKLSDLVDSVQKSVVLDQNTAQNILRFAEQLKGLTGGQLEFRTIPVVNPDFDTPEDGKAIQVEPSQVHEFIQGLTGAPKAQQQPSTGSANAATTVDVRNATGRQGLAAAVTQTLTGKGFTAGDTANANTRKTTVVRYPAGAQEAAQSVADALGGKVSVEQDTSVAAGHVTVLLGTDYSTSATSVKPQQAAVPTPAATPEAKPITADGVTCVN